MTRNVLCLDGPLEGEYFEANEGLIHFCVMQYKSRASNAAFMAIADPSIWDMAAREVVYRIQPFVLQIGTSKACCIWTASCEVNGPSLYTTLSALFRDEVMKHAEWSDVPFRG